MNKLSNKTLDVVSDIQNKIINHILKPGDHLSPLRDLAMQYNTSRSVINSAVHILSTQGYLDVVPRHYIAVNDFLYSGSLDIVRNIYMFSEGNLKRKTIEEVLSIRQLVELDAIDRIIRFAVSIDKLKAINAEEVKWLNKVNPNINEMIELDCQFHECLVSISGNSVLFLLYMSFKEIEHDLVKKFYISKEEVSSVVGTHTSFITAMLLNNGVEAKQIWQKLLLQGEQTVLHEFTK